MTAILFQDPEDVLVADVPMSRHFWKLLSPVIYLPLNTFQLELKQFDPCVVFAAELSELEVLATFCHS